VKDLIASSKSILIALPEKLCFDTAASAIGLAHILKNLGKEVKIGTVNPIPLEFSKVLNHSDFEIVNSLGKKEIVLSLNKQKGEVQAVRWREVGNKIQFIITPTKGDFEYNNVDLESSGGDFDLFITIGCKSLEATGKLSSTDPAFFNDKKIINIDINPANTNFGTENKVEREKSLSTWVLKLAEQETFTLNKDAIDALFKGIFWSNDGFRQNEDLQEALQKFTANGGNISLVASQMFDTLTIAELRYIGKLISNLKIDSDSILISKVSKSEIQGVRLDRILYPEINIISRVQAYKVALILSEYETGKILVRAYSKDEQFDIFSLFSEYSPVGNSRRVTFSIDGNLDEIESNLVATIKGQQTMDMKPKEVKVEKVESENSTKNSQGSLKQKEPLQKADSLPNAVDAPPINPLPPLSQMPGQRPMNTLYPQQPLSPVTQ
jgi:nanoRNase/pAp phosphatase (c-di-AMP/oligoRNAs hydrolase)